MKWFLCAWTYKGLYSSHYDTNKMLDIMEFKTPLSRFKHVEENALFAIASNQLEEPARIGVFEKRYIIVGDIALHNLKELKLRLGMKEQETINVEQLIAGLYHSYGKCFVELLVGEFAFIIWDKIANSVFAVRDQLGIKTLFWLKEKENDIYWIASDIAVLRNYINTGRLNHQYFQEYLRDGGHINSSNTPYPNLMRVMPASWIFIEKERQSSAQYWKLEDLSNCMLKYENKNDYYEEFKQLMSTIVECRLSTKTVNSIFLSGGLDSTTIFSMACELGNHSFQIQPLSVIYDKFRSCDESGYTKELLHKYNVKGEFINGDEALLFSDFPDHSLWSYEPHVDGLSFAFSEILLARANELESCNVLTGFGGDHLLGGGAFILGDLVATKQFTKFLKETSEYAKSSRESFTKLAIRHLLNNLVEPKMTNHQKSLLKQIKGFEARIFFDRVMCARYGINASHPFFDRRIVEYIYRIPGDLVWGNDGTKLILRNSMTGILPEKIRLRKGKTEHAPVIFTGLKKYWATLLPILLTCRISKLGLVNKEEWTSALHNFRQGKIMNYDGMWIFITLELWLYQFEKRYGPFSEKGERSVVHNY